MSNPSTRQREVEDHRGRLLGPQLRERLTTVHRLPDELQIGALTDRTHDPVPKQRMVVGHDDRGSGLGHGVGSVVTASKRRGTRNHSIEGRGSSPETAGAACPTSTVVRVSSRRPEPDLAEELELRDELLIACRTELLRVGTREASALVAHFDALLDLDDEASPGSQRG